LLQQSLITGNNERSTPLGYRLVLRPERSDFEVGEEARVHFDSPFEDAEAWITFEREGIIEQRRQRAQRATTW
jgi:uncharacterized protein YfaS (alpha-2-macroglobulin family)